MAMRTLCLSILILIAQSSFARTVLPDPYASIKNFNDAQVEARKSYTKAKILVQAFKDKQQLKDIRFRSSIVSALQIVSFGSALDDAKKANQATDLWKAFYAKVGLTKGTDNYWSEELYSAFRRMEASTTPEKWAQFVIRYFDTIPAEVQDDLDSSLIMEKCQVLHRWADFEETRKCLNWSVKTPTELGQPTPIERAIRLERNRLFLRYDMEREIQFIQTTVAKNTALPDQKLILLGLSMAAERIKGNYEKALSLFTEYESSKVKSLPSTESILLFEKILNLYFLKRYDAALPIIPRYKKLCGNNSECKANAEIITSWIHGRKGLWAKSREIMQNALPEIKKMNEFNVLTSAEAYICGASRLETKAPPAGCQKKFQGYTEQASQVPVKNRDFAAINDFVQVIIQPTLAAKDKVKLTDSAEALKNKNYFAQEMSKLILDVSATIK